MEERMSRVVTFGEIMMRLNPDGYMELLQAPSLNISFAGGEANAADPLQTLEWMWIL